MDVRSLLTEAESQGIFLFVENNKLKYKSKVGGLPNHLRDGLKTHKGEIINWLTSASATHQRYAPIERQPAQTPLILSFAQQRMWFLNQYMGPNAVYNIPLMLQFDGDLNPVALLESIHHISLRHASLRTRFSAEGDHCVPVIEEAVDRQGLEQVEYEAVVFAVYRDEASYPFDLSKDRLFRARLIHIADTGRYVLIAVFHHAIFDGWSRTLFIQELKANYQYIANGEAPVAEPLPVQYTDYAHWQRENAGSDGMRRQLEYWRQQLNDLPSVTNLPTDRARPAQQSFGGRVLYFGISEETTEKMESLSRDKGVTVFMTLYSVFSLLLSRYSGDADIAIGTTMANRTQRHLEELIGFFINTLVLRSRVEQSLHFDEFMESNKAMILDAYDNQDVPFEMLVDELNPQRSTGYSPLFQVMLVYQNAPQEEAADQLDELSRRLLPGSDSKPGIGVADHSSVSHFDITLSMKRCDTGLQAAIEYNTDIFDAPRIRAMSEHFVRLLEDVIDSPGRTLGEYQCLSDDEIKQQVFILNNTERLYPQNLTVHELFERRAVETPEATAVVWGAWQMSYGELNRRANQLAHYLSAEGIGPEARVGVCLKRSAEMMVALLGVLKAGACYVPLDAAYPDERLRYIVDDSQCRLVLTDQSVADRRAFLSGLNTLVLDAPSLQAVLSACPQNNIACDVSGVQPENLAYINYTSGSTGKPKGSAITHRNIARLVFADFIPFARERTFLCAANLSFDAITFELWGSLLHGARCVLADLTTLSFQELGALIESQAIDCAVLTTALFNQIVNESVQSLAGLRHLLVGGEALSKTHVQKVLKALPDTRILNGYGPTENTTFTCVLPLDGDVLASSPSVPIGGPIANTTAYVLDRQGRLVVPGAIGELCVGGAGVSRGYVNRPALTAEKFVPHPFAQVPGERLHRTGDLVRYLPDGNLQFIGRLDNQVQIRGFRIEPEEVAAALKLHEHVKDAEVLVREDTIGKRHIVAYTVISGNAAAGAAAPDEGRSLGELTPDDPLAVELRAHLKKHLPAYMTPSAIVVLPAMPLTENGKLDRKKLPEPFYFHRSDYAAPTSAVERLLSEIWRDLLAADDIGIDDNFFECGGDSILSIQLVSRARSHNLALSVRQVFEHQTIRKLAKVVQAIENDIDQAPSTGDMPLLPIQNWLLSKQTANPSHFLQSQLLSVPAHFSNEVLRMFVQHLYQRHDALRMRFHNSSGKWRATFHPFDGEWIDRTTQEANIAGLSEEERVARIRSVSEKAKADIDIHNGPILKVVYFNASSSGQSYLLLTIHHLVVDGVSWRILLKDLQLWFSQWRENRVIQSQGKTVSYQRWSESLGQYFSHNSLEAERAFWRRQIPDSGHESALHQPDSVDNTYVGSHQVAISLSEEETSALVTRCPKAYHTQIQDLMLAGLWLAYSQWSGQRELYVKLEGHGREPFLDELNLSETVGWFTTLHPLKLSITDTSPERAAFLGHIIKSVKEQLRSIPHNGIGFGILRYIERDELLATLDRPHPQQIVFNYLGQFDQNSGDGPLFEPVGASTGDDIAGDIARDYFIGVSGAISQGRLRLSVDYNPRVHQPDAIKELSRLLKGSLCELIAHCGQQKQDRHTPSDFSMATALSLSQYEAWEQKYTNIQTVYPVTGMQLGFIFHTLLDVNNEAYASQLYVDFVGDFKPDLFRAAWSVLIARHAVFRTAFAGLELEEPYQIVVQSADVNWHVEDWRGKDEHTQANDFERFRISDKGKGFEFDAIPLMRMSLIRLADNRFRWLWTHHHSILDGWSMPIILQELLLSYEGMLNGLKPLLPPAPGYEDYIRWLKAQNRQDAIAYWKNELAEANLPAPIGIRYLKNREIPPSAAEHSLVVDPVEASALRSFATDNGVTLNAVFQAAWAILLWRYTGEKDIVFGQTISGRPPEVEGIESIAGLFINTLPVRVKLTEGVGICQFLQCLNQNQAKREGYGYLPLVEIKSGCGLSASDDIFDALMVVQNYPSQDALKKVNRDKQGGLGFKIDKIGSNVATTYGLTLVIAPGDSILVKLEYNGDAFISSEVEQLLGRFKTVLLELCNNRNRLLSDIRAEPAENTLRGIAQWNSDRREDPAVFNIHQLFEQQVEKAPENVAVVHEGRRYTYQELNERSNRLANKLIDDGVRSESLVALYTESSLYMLIGIFGILKTGGAYVPIDPSFPRKRVGVILRDSKAAHLITQKRLYDDQEVFESSRTLVLEDFEKNDRGPGHTASNPHVRGVRQENIAYAIYTSGSTGTPKGVMVSHQNVSNYLLHGSSYLDDTITSSVVSSSLAFDATVSSIFIPLINGKTVEILPQDETLIEHLVDCIADDSGSLLFKLTPSHLRAILDSQLLAVNKTSRHVFVIGGEQLPRSVLEQLLAVLPQSTFINEYGPTEATVGCCVFEFGPATRPHMDDTVGDVPIGHPIANAQLYILSEALELQPDGIPGELAIAGEGLARGYIGRAALTAEKFIPNPWSAPAGGRLYLTGDKVCRLPTGELLYLGRKDDQVKIRGRRIEPGEIEFCLNSMPFVSAAVVLLSVQDAENPQLWAFVVARESEQHRTGTERDVYGTIATELQKHLPEYMVPARIVAVDEIPLTVSGKVDKQALLGIDIKANASADYRPPRDATETRLCELWQQILRVESVGIHDNFFTLGGHSILATRLISWIREEFSVELGLRALFDAPTVAGLSHCVKTTSNQFVLPAVTKARRDQVIPLSFAQQRLWFIDQLGEGSAHYNMVGAFLLTSTFDEAAFKQAVRGVLERHEALRTHFAYENGQPCQVIKDSFEIPFKYHDLTVFSDEVKAQRIHNLFQHESSTVFKLDSDLMLRVNAVSIADYVHIVLYTIHHIAGDGWSMRLLQNEFKHQYEAFSQDRESALKPVSLQYADYSQWQRDWLKGEVLQEQLEYWRAQLNGVPQLHSLPLDFKRPVQQMFRGKVHIQSLCSELARAVIDLCEKYNVTLFTFLETAFAVLLGRYGDEDQIAVGAAVAGRNHRDLEETVGFFINAVVLRTDLSGDPTFGDLLERSKATILDAYAHQHIPFETLVEDIRPERSLSYNPLFQMMFAVETIAQDESFEVELDPDIEALLMELKKSQSRSSTTRSDLQVQVINANGVISVNWVYNQSLFAAETITTLAESYSVLLHDIAGTLGHGPELAGTTSKRLSELSVIGAHQSDRLMNFGIGEKQVRVGEYCLHGEFEKQVVKTPNNVAVVLDAEAITYEQLNLRANQLARLLIRQGVKPNTVVGLCCEQSIEMMVGVMGILKAGAAYLPLDPSLPSARLVYMLENCCVDIVLTEQELLSDMDFGDRKALPLDDEVLSMLTGETSDNNLTEDEVSVSAEGLAYVIYTSGSTGKPKGVAVSHKAAVIYCEGASQTYYKDSLSGSVVVTSFSVDMTVPSLYLPLFHGHSVRLMPGPMILDSLKQCLLDSSDRFLVRMTPSHATALLALMPVGHHVQSEHVFAIGGEALHRATVSRLQRVFPRATIVNHYGPTEAVVGCAVNQTVDADVANTEGTGSVPIGRPMSNVELYVLGKDGDLQLPGSIGELAIGGEGLAIGYINEPELTCRKFIERTFKDPRESTTGKAPGHDAKDTGVSKRLYCTGDLVRWLPDGNLAFIGRIDDQAKVRGYRIEIGEIESAVKALDGVKDVAVVISAPANHEQMLIAYIVPEGPIEGTEDLEINQKKAELVRTYKEQLARSLPGHMIPTVYVLLERLPLSANGKIEKSSLPEPEETDLNSEAYVAPTSDTQVRLCEIWRDIFKLHRVGINENFFSLGGHSLLATSLISTLREEYDVDLPVKSVFEFPTIADLSIILAAQLANRESRVVDTEEVIL